MYRKRFDYRFQPAQFVPRLKRTFGGQVGCDQIGVGQDFKGHHLVTPGIVYHHVARDREQKAAPLRDALIILGGKGPRHYLRDHVVHIAVMRGQPTQARAQRGFMRKYHFLEPTEFRSCRMHGRLYSPLVNRLSILFARN